MSERVIVGPKDATYLRIEASPAIERELTEHFSYEIEGARYMPSVRARKWDGRIRLYKRGLLYAGLLQALESFCVERDYELVRTAGIEPTRRLPQDFKSRASTNSATSSKEQPSYNSASQQNHSHHVGRELLIGRLQNNYMPRDYQIQAFEWGLRHRRVTFLSPTASGKTLMSFLMASYHKEEGNVLIIVPTTALVHQGLDDFRKYGFKGDIQGIVGGASRQVTSNVVISTWQSIMREPKEWMKQFSTIIVDECHTAKSNSLQTILSAATRAYNRYGFTGTIYGAKTHEMMMIALLGPVHRVTSIGHLMDIGLISRAEVNMLVLSHPKSVRKQLSKEYQKEIETIISCEARNDFVARLALKLTGNTLVLYTRVSQHGELIFKKVRQFLSEEKPEGRNIHFLHGEIEGEVRNDIRAIVEKAKNDIIIASFGVFAQGIDITRIHNIILASPHKSEILIPQAIGRGLRISSDKEKCRIYDVIDDFSWGRRKNYAMKHAEIRLRIYAEQEFSISSYHVDLDYIALNRKEIGGNQCLSFT